MLLIFLYVIGVSTVVAQQTLITLPLGTQTLQQATEAVASQSGFAFAYSSDQVNLNKQVNVRILNQPLDKALRELLKGTGISFMIQGKQVLLYKDATHRYIISGKVSEQGSGELLIGVVVGVEPTASGGITNAFGVYSIAVPEGSYRIKFQYLGFKPYEKQLVVDRDIELNPELVQATNLNEVVIQDDEVYAQRANTIVLPLKEIQSVPMILGERDAVKYAMMGSGVQKGNEGNSYMYVRGGGPDQNLIMMDDAVIYNAYHFLGLASLVSGSELRHAELIKGGFSSKYGGRLSSVLDLRLKDGNTERMGFDATAGAISSKLMIEGPIVKHKSSFLVSARKSYIDKVSKWVVEDESAILDYSFYDVHAKLASTIGKRDRVMWSAYMGNDNFDSNDDPNLSSKDDGISWGNRMSSLRWSHQFNPKWFMNSSAVYSYYKTSFALAGIEGQGNEYVSTSIASEINDFTLKSDFEWMYSNAHHIRIGGGITQHRFSPITQRKNLTTGSISVKDQSFIAEEAFAYGEWDFRPNQYWQIAGGMRLTYFENNKGYFRAEPRLTVQYQTPKNWIWNGSYSLMNQYLHLITTFSGLGFPNDLWVSSDENLAPQRSHLITAGITKRGILKTLSFTTEVYAKQLENTVGLRENTSFLDVLPPIDNRASVDKWSELATQGKGQSYGIEFTLKKEGDRFQSWISYTLSKTTLQFEDVNNGRSFPATFDRRHDLGTYVSYRTPKHWQFSANWVVGTGNAISLPVGEFYTVQNLPQGSLSQSFTLLDYESKNAYRMRTYHRLDISIQFRHRIGKQLNSTIELSVYNTYNRANPFYYIVEQEYSESGPGRRKVQQMSLFPVIPSISWSISL